MTQLTASETWRAGMEDLNELWNRKEELHEDLRQYLGEIPSLGQCLRHPLVFAVPYSPHLNALHNRSYQLKLDALKRASSENDWLSYIFLHERPYRIQTFFALAAEEILTDIQYWELLGRVWTDSENIWQNQEELEEALTCNRSAREKIMSKEDYEFLRQLPEKITIYRGHTGVNRIGHSWSLSPQKARWFANRYQAKPGKVHKMTVSKKDVIAYHGGRGEFEIVVSLDTVRKKKLKLLKPLERSAELQSVLDDCKARFKLTGRTDHGSMHWEQVEINAISLASKTPGADMLVCRLFAIVHDCCRENEMHDPLHGVRASDFYLKNKKKWNLGLTNNQEFTLLDAMNRHNDGTISKDPTIGCCWDADRLDLPRVGIIPSKKLLSTQAGKNLLWNI